MLWSHNKGSKVHFIMKEFYSILASWLSERKKPLAFTEYYRHFLYLSATLLSLMHSAICLWMSSLPSFNCLSCLELSPSDELSVCLRNKYSLFVLSFILSLLMILSQHAHAWKDIMCGLVNKPKQIRTEHINHGSFLSHYGEPLPPMRGVSKSNQQRPNFISV